MATYDNISRYLISLNFHFSPEWLSGCVCHYKTENPSITETQLKEDVVSQWLLLDLRECQIGAFPPNLRNAGKTVLTGKYACQVETMIDSGQSRYSQLQNMLNQSCDNVKATLKKHDDDLPGRRCLTMTLTDGVQNLSAMEYEIIPCLKLNDPNLLPGFKMVITGPVVCRKGMIMLSAKNVQVFGGEVGELIEKNRYPALLAQTLGMDVPEGIVITTDALPRANSPPPVSNVNVMDSYVNQQFSDLLADNDDLFFELPMDEENDSPTLQHQNIQRKDVNATAIVPSEPFVYLAQIPDVSVDRIYKVKAFIWTLKTKISIKDGEFTLKAKICDGSLSIDVEFSSDVLENLIGFTPNEMVKIVKEKNRNSAVAEKLRNAFKFAQNKLISLNCIVHVKFFADKSKVPEVMLLEEITRLHVDKMYARKM